MADPNSLLFRPSVVIETSRPGRLRAVGSVREATELLFGNWPADSRGSAWRNACEAAHAALAGTLEPEYGPQGVHRRREGGRDACEER